MTAPIEQQLQAAHQAATDAVQAVLDAAFTGGDVVAATIQLQAAEEERRRLETEYEAAQAAQATQGVAK